MINLGTRREVFFDDYLINEDKSTADILLHKPVPEDIVMLFDKEGNLASSCEMFGNSTDKLIGFEKDLSAFAGKEVVMTVRMCDADLYAIRFLKE